MRKPGFLVDKAVQAIYHTIMKTVPFNINDYVRVRLTPYGHKALFDQYLALISHYPYKTPPFPYSAPKEDENGWSKWQMWDLMSTLGGSISMGGPNPFETSIEIEAKIET